jgi:GT2 family glycosyltransferase
LDLSVIIPTRDRWPLVRRTVEAVLEQDAGGARVEVVVVDNGPVPEAATGVAGARVVHEPTPGAAAARNRGVAEAEGDLVLFLGDDCRPARPGFLRGHLEAHAEGGRRAVVGGIEWDPGVERTAVMDWLERAGHMVDVERLRRGTPGPETFYTGNVSLPRGALLEVAGFDQRFSGYGWEDLDLALRLADRGLRFEHRPGLLVWHSHVYRFGDSVARMRAVGRGARLLHVLHDHRRPLPGPPAGRGRLVLGRVAAPVARAAPPARLPARARDAWLRGAHLAAFADGYLSADPLAEDPRLRGYGAVPAWSDEPRPGVSVIVPFGGNEEEAQAARAALERLDLGADDELIVADNSESGHWYDFWGQEPQKSTQRPEPDPLNVHRARPRIVSAWAERSSYHARNAGADAAARDWLLFLDADTRPPASLVDDYFREPIDERCGAVAGGVVAARQGALLARYAASRRYLSQAAHFRDVHRPYGITANLLVRRAAFDAVGGFLEGLRSGGDADFSWRIQDAGWTLAYREPAAIEHLHRERLLPLLRQMARYSAAIAWQERRLPGSAPRPRVLRGMARAGAGVAGWLVLRRPERALFKAIDGLVVVAEGLGHLLSNDAPHEPPSSAAALVVAEHPTAASVAAAAELGDPAVEAERRPPHPVRPAPRAAYAEDDGTLRRAAALLRVGPRRALRARAEPAPPEPAPRLRLRDLAAPARRLRRAGVRAVHAPGGDPAATARASILARLAGLRQGRV